MFPNGLSVLTHLSIVLLGLSKRLVEVVAEKMKWDIFKFKMNLYLGWKIFNPLTSQAGDNLARRVFSYIIILAVASMVISATAVSIGSAFEKNSNIELAREFMNGGYAQAKEKVGSIVMKESVIDLATISNKTEEGLSQKYAYLLPMSEDVKKINDNSRNYPALR
jgi:hypothetical protein